MKFILSTLSFFLAVFAFLFTPAAIAQNKTTDNYCFEDIEAMNFALQGLPEDSVTAISLKDQDQTRYILFIAFEKNENSDTSNTGASWRVIERHKDSSRYCLAGAGRSSELLKSLHSIPGFDAEFGLPSSFNRRCNDESDGVLGSMAVRSWANKELGPSFVQALGEPFKGNSYTVLLADNAVQGKFPWIILQIDGSQSCYHARGDDSALVGKFKMRAELVQDPSTLTPLE